MNIAVIKKSFFRYFIISTLFFSTVVIYQNCGEVGVSELTSQNTCKDSGKNLFILDSTRLTDTGWGNPSTIQLQIFEELPNGTMLLFRPQDPSTLASWPPRWFKDGTELPPAEERKTSTVQDVACQGNLFEAKFSACGQERVLKKRYFTGTCVPVKCELNGVTANIGEEGTFYLSETVPCNQTCQSIQRECIIDPATGNPVFAGDPSYSFSSCSTQTNCPTTTTTSTTTSTTSTTTPSPVIDIEPGGCTPHYDLNPGSSWRSTFDLPWPYGSRRRIEAEDDQALVLKFRTTPVGALTTTGPISWGFIAQTFTPDQGMGIRTFKMYFSKTAGCIDENSLPPGCMTDQAGLFEASLAWHLPHNPISINMSCPLNYDTEYFLNIYCPGNSRCVMDVQPFLN